MQHDKLYFMLDTKHIKEVISRDKTKYEWGPDLWKQWKE